MYHVIRKSVQDVVKRTEDKVKRTEDEVKRTEDKVMNYTASVKAAEKPVVPPINAASQAWKYHLNI